MELLWKTSNGENPRGLYRIYFIAHPDEYEKCLEELSSDIFKQASCAVWYKSDPAESIESDILSSFNLIVVGVTRRFLCEENIGRDVELSIVTRSNIPVLPILDSLGMDAEYSRFFGNRQYLVKCPSHNGEIDYEDKLRLFLSRRIVSTALIERIVNNFDATFFLSYRKKDRVAARRLISAIHSDPRLRGIAIWFDEYLLPGEDFSCSIEEALDSSILFILALTKNMVNEENYVSRVEFPLAVKNSKTILPVALETVDGILLNERFPDLPPSLSLYGEALSDSLRDALGQYGTEERRDADSVYLTALAYFLGIYTEQNPEIAIELFEKGAESGSTASISALVDIYANGDFCDRDLKKAVKYQKRLVDLARREHKKYYTVTTLSEYSEARMRLAALYLASGKIGKAGSELRFIYSMNEQHLDGRAVDAYGIFKVFMERTYADEKLFGLVKSTLVPTLSAEALAAVYLLIGHLESSPERVSLAENYLSRALSLVDRELEGAFKDWEIRAVIKRRSMVCDAFIDGSLNTSGLETLLERVAALRVSEPDAEEPYPEERKLDRKRLFMSMMCRSIKDDLPIENAFLLPFDIIRKNRIKRICRKRNYSLDGVSDVSYEKISLFAEMIASGMRWESLLLSGDDDLYDYVGWFERTDLNPDSVETAAAYERIYNRIIEVTGHSTLLLDKYISICEYLNENDPESPKWRRRLAQVKLKRIYEAHEYDNDAECYSDADYKNCSEAYGLIKSCMGQDHSLPLKRDLVACCSIWADVCEGLSLDTEACGLYREAADILISTCLEERERMRVRLVDTLIAESALNRGAAYELIKKAIGLLSSAEPSVKREKTALCYKQLARVGNACGEYGEARLYAIRAADAYREMSHDREDSADMYADSLLQLLRAERGLGNKAEAERIALILLGFFENSGRAPTAADQLRLARTLFETALIRSESEPEEATVCCKRAVELLLSHRDSIMRKDVYELLYPTYVLLCRLCRRTGRLAESVSFYFKAVAVITRLDMKRTSDQCFWF